MDILRRVSKNHPSRKPQGVRLDCDDGSHRHSTKTCVKQVINSCRELRDADLISHLLFDSLGAELVKVNLCCRLDS